MNFFLYSSVTSLEPVTQEAGLLSVTTSGDHIKVPVLLVCAGMCLLSAIAGFQWGRAITHACSNDENIFQRLGCLVLMWRFHYQIVIDTILTSRLILLRKARERNI